MQQSKIFYHPQIFPTPTHLTLGMVKTKTAILAPDRLIGKIDARIKALTEEVDFGQLQDAVQSQLGIISLASNTEELVEEILQSTQLGALYADLRTNFQRVDKTEITAYFAGDRQGSTTELGAVLPPIEEPTQQSLQDEYESTDIYTILETLSGYGDV